MREKSITGKPAIKFTRDNFLIVILVGVLLLVIAWPVEEKKEKGSEESVQWDSKGDILGLQSEDGSGNEGILGQGGETASADVYAFRLEQSLEALLSTMDGVGRVKVMVTLKDSGENIVEKDTSRIRNGTTEVDSAGGSRNTTGITDSEETRYQNGQGGAPYVKQRLCPRVEGVAVSAEGGGNAQTVRNITEAIQALFGIEAHKIKIVKMISQ